MFIKSFVLLYITLSAIALLVRPKLYCVALYFYLCNDNKLNQIRSLIRCDSWIILFRWFVFFESY